MKTSHSSNAFSRNPLFVLAAAFAAGVWLESLEAERQLPVSLLIIAIAASIFSERARTIALTAGFVCAGVLCAWLEQNRPAATSLSRLYDDGWILSGDPVEIDAVLIDQPRAVPDGYVIAATVKRITYKREIIATDGNVRVFTQSYAASVSGCSTRKLRAGNTVNLSLRLKREEPFLNPGTRSFIRSLDRNGIAATGNLKSCLLIELRGSDESWLSPFFFFREWLTRRILLTHDERSAGIILASMLGNRSFLTRDSGETFRENGTFHVLVISGLHITILGGFLLVLFRGITRRRSLQFLAANLLVWLYAVVVGLQVPVFRAAIMYTVFLLAYAIHARFSAPNALGAASLIILVWRPSDLLDSSFQLTFLSVFAIVCFAIPMIRKLKETGGWMPTSRYPFPPATSRPVLLFSEALYWSKISWDHYRARQYWDCAIKKTALGESLADSLFQKVLQKTFEIVFVTFSVQVFTLPLLVLNFHRIGAGSLFSNLFAGAAVLAQDTAAIIAVLISLVEIDAAASFSAVTAHLTIFSMAAMDVISGFLIQPARVPIYTGPASSVYLLYFAPLAGITVLAGLWKPVGRTGRKTTGNPLRGTAICLLASLGGIIIFHPYSSPPPDNRLSIDFLDVGQGDAALVRFPSGETMLVDGGGRSRFGNWESGRFERDRFRIGEFVVSEFLWEKGYSELDFVLSTHPDADHIEGLIDVLQNFSVGAVLVGGNFEGEPGFDELQSAAELNGISLLIIKEGTRMKFGSAAAFVLNPPAGVDPSPGNDDSVVIRFEFGSRSVLLTGDIGAKTERLLISGGFLLATDVVKAAHHGSRTSSTQEFVAQVQAKYVVIPAGKRSPYGHPHTDVLERWQSGGARVIVIGQNGAVRVSTDGKDLRLQGF